MGTLSCYGSNLCCKWSDIKKGINSISVILWCTEARSIIRAIGQQRSTKILLIDNLMLKLILVRTSHVLVTGTFVQFHQPEDVLGLMHHVSLHTAVKLVLSTESCVGELSAVAFIV